MSHNLPRNDGQFTTDELTERFNIDPDDTPGNARNTSLNLAVALVLMDDLMGDDPVKFEAMQALVTALAGLDNLADMNTVVEYSGAEITVSEANAAESDPAE